MFLNKTSLLMSINLLRMSDEENPISPVHQNNLCNSKNAGSSSDVHNPSPPPSDGLECLTGDAIGDTLYSQRWVLRSLMKLNEVSRFN